MILTVTMNPAVDKVYLVDNYAIGKVFRTDNVVISAGGKGINVARVAKELGADVGATGLVGGNNGRIIIEEINRLNIINQFCDIDGETRINTNITDRVNKTSTELLEYGPNVQNKEMNEFLKLYSNIVNEYNVIVLSGSLPRGLEQNSYNSLIDIAHKLGKKVILDTSGSSLIDALDKKVYMIKPNTDEIKQILDLGEATLAEDVIIDAAIGLKNRGIDLPVISMGSGGCVAYINSAVYHFKADASNVVNTVGSGDSFIAGCAVGIDRGLSQLDTLRLAIACGTANTQFEQTGIVTKELVEHYLDKVEIVRLA